MAARRARNDGASEVEMQAPTLAEASSTNINNYFVDQHAFMEDPAKNSTMSSQDDDINAVFSQINQGKLPAATANAAPDKWTQGLARIDPKQNPGNGAVND